MTNTPNTLDYLFERIKDWAVNEGYFYDLFQPWHSLIWDYLQSSVVSEDEYWRSHITEDEVDILADLLHKAMKDAADFVAEAKAFGY